MPKTVRKNLAVLADQRPRHPASPNAVVDLSTVDAKRTTMHNHPGSEMDRYMIALLRAQTEGRVAYRRLMGIHGGGFATSLDKAQLEVWKNNDRAKDHRPLMMVKADLDEERIILEDWDSKHNNQDEEDDGKWPSPQNNVTPAVLSPDQKYLGHTFCWHGQSPFLTWHRPLMVEFERLLQEYDPLNPGLHVSENALGAHYYDWDGWDGMTLPPFINYPTYKIKTEVFHDILQGVEGYNSYEGTIVSPLYRWFTPMQPEYQLNETFPTPMPEDSNCTTREPAIADVSGGTLFVYRWPKTDINGDPSIETCIRESMREKDYLAFCTTTHNGNSSIEHSHNLFHNRVGGDGGTMSPLQSMFDPLFLVHHSNVERQLVSWQKVWSKDRGESTPPDWLMDTRLYPWTKPDLVKKGSLSWNTDADVDQNGEAAETTTNDGTVRDWWDYKALEYEYDEYITITKPLRGGLDSVGSSKVLMTVQLPVLSSGHFDLCITDISDKEDFIDSVSLIIGNNPADSTTTTCSQCKKRSHLTVVFNVTGFVTPYDFNKFQTDPTNNISNLLVRHKGEKYTVANGDITIKSVRNKNKHMKEIRKELARRSTGTKGKRSQWNCLGASDADVIITA
jgi:hypothetical protein